MKIELPKWFKDAVGYTLIAPAFIVGTMFGGNGTTEYHFSPLEECTQIYATADSCMTVTPRRNTDTTTAKDSLGKILWDSTGRVLFLDTVRVARALDVTLSGITMRRKNGSVYDNGFTQHVFRHDAVDLLTGEVTGEYVIGIIPPVGTQTNFKFRCGRSELAEEKIPERLESLPVEKANEIGWYAVKDTVKIDEGVSELKTRWTTDKDAKPVKIDEKPLGELTDVEK
jgi:hypothetical protein